MLAVAVFAMAQIVMKFDKAMRDLFRLQMPQSKLTHAVGVDNVAAVREMIQARGRGGVLSKAGVVRDIIGQISSCRPRRLLSRLDLPTPD